MGYNFKEIEKNGKLSGIVKEHSMLKMILPKKNGLV